MGFFRRLYQMTAGRTVDTMETTGNNGQTTLALSLKQETGGGKLFVVLAVKSADRREYVHFSPSEYALFAADVAAIQTELAKFGRA